MASCICGAPIEWREVGDEKVAFDVHEVARGEGRYIERPEGLVPVAEHADVMAWQRHDVTCAARSR